MKSEELLGAWSLTSRGPTAWLAYCSSESHPEALTRACAATIARPIDPREVVDRLVDAGEFDTAELLLQEPSLLPGVDAEVLRKLEAKLEWARAATIEEIQGKLADLHARTATFGVAIDHPDIVQAAKRRRSAGDELLDQHEQRVGNAEAAVVRRLREALASVEPAGLDEIGFDEWRASVEHAISLGAIEAASAEIAMGPSRDRTPLVSVPSAPVWPYRSEPLHLVLDWMFGDGVIPPGFERHRPEAEDADAWRFLGALRERETETVLSGIAGVLESKLVNVDIRGDGVLGRLANLAVPGFHALSLRAWPSGIPIWLPAAGGVARSGEVGSGLVIEVAVGPRAGSAAQHVLRLDIHDVLAVIRDRKYRRARLLAQLGRQLPLQLAFAHLHADAAVSWERSDVPTGVTNGEFPVIVAGAPGIGKSTLLLELAEAVGKRAMVVSAAAGHDLPEAELVLIDDVNSLDADRLRALVRDVHWARTTRTPPPRVAVAARPETVVAIERLAKKVFQVVELPPRSSAALREQARTMLGWVGIEATAPGSYDSLAFLAGGNPTVLLLLCRALTKVLAQENIDHRRFKPYHLRAAWEDSEFRAAVRMLLWTPLRDFDGALDTLGALVDFCEPPEPLALEDLTWLLKEKLGEREPEWIVERLTLLRRYGLVREVPGGFGLRLGGAGLLVRTWLEEDRQGG